MKFSDCYVENYLDMNDILASALTANVTRDAKPGTGTGGPGDTDIASRHA